jgi:hypothetical protein
MKAPTLAHAVDQAADMRPILRAGAHRARLDGGDQRAAPQVLGRVARGGGACEQRLGVFDGADVALFEQHGFIVTIDQHRAEGVMAPRCRITRHVVGTPQVSSRLISRHSACGLDERAETRQIVSPEQSQSPLLRLFEVQHFEDPRQYGGGHDLRLAELLQPVLRLDCRIIV